MPDRTYIVICQVGRNETTETTTTTETCEAKKEAKKEASLTLKFGSFFKTGVGHGYPKNCKSHDLHPVRHFIITLGDKMIKDLSNDLVAVDHS